MCQPALFPLVNWVLPSPMPQPNGRDGARGRLHALARPPRYARAYTPRVIDLEHLQPVLRHQDDRA